MAGKKTKANRKKIRKTKLVKKKSNKKRIWGLILVALLIVIIVSIFAINLLKKKETTDKKNRSTTKVETSNKTITSCFRSPIFPMKHGLRGPYAVDLRQDGQNIGLRIMDVKTKRSLKLSGWDSFGYLGLYTLDNKGNIYTSPLPYVSIDINPPEEQNKLLIVDSRTGKMSEFMKLPSKNSPTAKNPFGVIGLGFDCDTKSLYASSVAGSTFNDESGKLFQIDPNTKKIINTYDNIDVLGISIFQGKTGKRMYLGMARKPEIYSIGLDENGGFIDDLKFEFSLVDTPGGGFHKAHRMKIKDGIMTLKAREFSFTLIAASNSLRTIYTFKYNKSNDKWEFIELHKDNGKK